MSVNQGVIELIHPTDEDSIVDVWYEFFYTAPFKGPASSAASDIDFYGEEEVCICKVIHKGEDIIDDLLQEHITDMEIDILHSIKNKEL